MGANWKPAKWAAVLAVGATASGPASAFYFKGWPGDGLQPPPSLIQSNAPPWGNPPSGRLFTDESAVYGKPREWTEGQSSPQVPEPATLVLAAAGLIGLGVRRFRNG